MNYTVILKYPDYITGSDDEYYIDTASGDTPVKAVESAQYQAMQVNGLDAGADPEDFALVALFEGEHFDISSTFSLA